MKIGNTIGPYKGLYWIDTEKKILTIRYGRVSASSELEIPLSESQFAHLLEIMLPEPFEIIKGEKVARPCKIKKMA